MTPSELHVWALPGIPEVCPGDDVGALVVEAVERSGRVLLDGDVLVVTSKIVSKAEGRIVRADDREVAVRAETVRVVATRERPDGPPVRIVENRLGIVGAAAGVDASNTAEGTVLLLPVDPDASARRVRETVRHRVGVDVGVLVSDTLGRAWRIGQTDIVLGAAGMRVIEDLRGRTDTHGRPLTTTTTAVGDELAAAADLVKGKTTGRPVAVVRGVAHLVDGDQTSGRVLVRDGASDLFRMGTDEAIAEGYRRARQGEDPPRGSGG